MKNLITALLFGSVLLLSACSTTPTSTPDLDVKLKKAADAIEPIVGSALRRAIHNSPDHAFEIANYSAAIGTIFCQMDEQNKFDVAWLVEAADRATAQYQANLDDDVLDAKNASIALYKVFAEDQLVWQLPDNVWLRNITRLFCNAIDQALLDLGKPGAR